MLAMSCCLSTTSELVGGSKVALSEQEMYAAVVSNDAACDGVFFYAVQTTGIVCRPSCPSRKPSRANVRFFASLQEAIEQGYRPCKRCRPDAGLDYAPDRELVQMARSLIEREYSDPDLQRALPTRLGISSSQLRRLFRAQLGQTPIAYLRKVRIAKAEQLMRQSDCGMTEIALATGFGCLSSFYAAFQTVAGRSMLEYRQAAGLISQRRQSKPH